MVDDKVRQSAKYIRAGMALSAERPASGNNGAGKPGTQPSQNSPFTPNPDFAQYGNNGGLPSPGPGGNYSSNGGGGAGGAGEDNPNSGPGGYGGDGIQIPATFRDPSNQYGAQGPDRKSVV